MPDIMEIVIRARDQASAEIKRVSNSFSEVQKSALTLKNAIAGVFGAIAVQKTIQFATQAVNDFVKETDALRRVEGLLASQGVAWKNVEQSVRSFANAMQYTAGIADTEVYEAMSGLIARGYDLASSQAVVDGAMKMALATGQDFANTIQMIEMAGMGFARQLKRMGIEVRELRDGSVDLEHILGQIDERFGATAQARMNDYSVQVKKTEAMYSDLREEIGKRLLPAFQKLLEWKMKILAFLHYFVQGFKVANKAFELFLVTVMAVANILKSFSLNVLVSLGESFKSVFSGIIKMLAPFASAMKKIVSGDIAGAIEDLQKISLKNFQDTFAEVSKNIPKIWKDNLGNVTDVIKSWRNEWISVDNEITKIIKESELKITRFAEKTEKARVRAPKVEAEKVKKEKIEKEKVKKEETEVERLKKEIEHLENLYLLGEKTFEEFRNRLLEIQSQYNSKIKKITEEEASFLVEINKIIEVLEKEQTDRLTEIYEKRLANLDRFYKLNEDKIRNYIDGLIKLNEDVNNEMSIDAERKEKILYDIQVKIKQANDDIIRQQVKYAKELSESFLDSRISFEEYHSKIKEIIVEFKKSGLDYSDIIELFRTTNDKYIKNLEDVSNKVGILFSPIFAIFSAYNEKIKELAKVFDIEVNVKNIEEVRAKIIEILSTYGVTLDTIVKKENEWLLNLISNLEKVKASASETILKVVAETGKVSEGFKAVEKEIVNAFKNALQQLIQAKIVDKFREFGQKIGGAVGGAIGGAIGGAVGGLAMAGVMKLFDSITGKARRRRREEEERRRKAYIEEVNKLKGNLNEQYNLYLYYSDLITGVKIDQDKITRAMLSGNIDYIKSVSSEVEGVVGKYKEMYAKISEYVKNTFEYAKTGIINTRAVVDKIIDDMVNDIIEKISMRDDIVKIMSNIITLIDDVSFSYAGNIDNIMSKLSKEIENLSDEVARNLTKISSLMYASLDITKYQDILSEFAKLIAPVEVVQENLYKALRYRGSEMFLKIVELTKKIHVDIKDKISSAIKEGLKANDIFLATQNFTRYIKEQLFENLVSAMINAFLQSSLYQKALAPFMTWLQIAMEDMSKGINVGFLTGVMLIEKAMEDLQPFVDRFAGLFEQVTGFRTMLGLQGAVSIGNIENNINIDNVTIKDDRTIEQLAVGITQMINRNMYSVGGIGGY